VEKEENVKRMITEIIRNPDKVRAMLVLEEWDRCVGAFTDKRTVEVVYGEVEKIILKEYETSFPRMWGRVFVLIPKTLPVVVLERTVDDTTSPIIDEVTVYVYTKHGWKRVKVH